MSVDFTFTPPASAPLDPGSSRSHAPKVLMADFGDGASQRAADGINNDPDAPQFSWTNLTEEESDAIDAFFTEMNGWQSFFYDPRNNGKPLVYICTDWKVVYNDYNSYTVSATFKQVFDI